MKTCPSNPLRLVNYLNYEKKKKHKSFNIIILVTFAGDTVAVVGELLYYRGYITKVIHQKSKLEVFLVDTGETKNVKYSQVSRLPSRFCTWTAQVRDF